MAIGDASDFFARLRAVLPPGWFASTSEGAASNTPVLDGLLSGSASVLAWTYALLAYVKQQSRILTATGVFLDIIANDFFGPLIFRRPNEGDAQFLARIELELFRPKVTRSAISKSITDLTGNVPIIIEPANPNDCGAYSYVEGIAIGGISGSRNSLSTALAPPIVGCAVYLHTAPNPTSDSNVGYFTAPSAIIGETVTAVCQIYVPSIYAGTAITFDVEAGTIASTAINMSLTNQWQAVTVSMVATTSGNQSFVLRATASGDVSRGFYSSAWGWRRSKSDPAFTYTGRAYNTSGVYGSLQMPLQFFITITAPAGLGVPEVMGYANIADGITSATGGYGQGARCYVSLSQFEPPIANAEILARLNDVRPVATIAWTDIIDG